MSSLQEAFITFAPEPRYEACASCGHETKVLFDSDGDYLCGYCKEKRAEDEATEQSIIEESKGVFNG